MSKKMSVVGATIALSLGLVSTLGSGVAAAKSESNPGGVSTVHGNHGHGGPATHDQNSAGDVPANHGEKGGTSGTAPSGTAPTGTNAGDGTAAPGKKGGKRDRSVAITGSTTCSIHGKVTFNPPLVSGGTMSSTVTVTGLLSRCHGAVQSNVKFNNGHLSSLVGSIGANDCASLSGVAPGLSGGAIMWTPPSKVAASRGLSMPTGTGSVNTSGKNSVIAISYSGGNVGSGSFTNTGGSSMTLTSTQDTTQISGRCTTGLKTVAFSGTATL